MVQKLIKTTSQTQQALFLDTRFLLLFFWRFLSHDLSSNTVREL
jgi:hypothetical protein